MTEAFASLWSKEVAIRAHCNIDVNVGAVRNGTGAFCKNLKKIKNNN